MTTTAAATMAPLARAATVRAAVLDGRDRLRAAGVEGPYLDAVVLLAHALGVSKERLFAAFPDALPAAVCDRYRELVQRRAAGEPVAYLRGYKEFYGRPFLVDRAVLIPRPETELLVEAVLRAGDRLAAARGGAVAVHDVGTGSGAIAVTVSLERPGWRVGGSDVSPAAVAVAQRNRAGLGAGGVHLEVCDLLPEAPAQWDLVAANLPYLSSAEVAALRRRHWPEPELALNGAADGLAPSRRLIDGARRRLRPGGALLMETAAERADDLARYLEERGFTPVTVEPDLAGRPRVVVAYGGPQ